MNFWINCVRGDAPNKGGLMTEDKGKSNPPEEPPYGRIFSMRLSGEERELLEAQAGSLPIAAYVRMQLFESPSPRRVFRRPVRDEKALTQVLGALGKSRLSSNLNQMAKAINSGSLPVSPETEQAILNACSQVNAMSESLVQALGLPEDKATPPKGGGS